MPFSKKTGLLGLLVVVLLALVLLASGPDEAQLNLPGIPAVDRDSVTRLTFSKAGQTTIIERSTDGWMMLQPLQARADAPLVEALLATFSEEKPVDLRVDDANYETYGLDDNNGLTFEVFTEGDEPDISMVVGWDVPGGSTLVRFSGSEYIYRVRIGGRYRLDRRPTEWRNRTLLGIDPGVVETIAFTSQGARTAFRRVYLDSSADDASFRWSLVQDPRFPVDQVELGLLLDSICRMRASQVHAEDFGVGWDDPLVVLELSLADGSVHILKFVQDESSAGVGLVKVDGDPEVFQVPLRNFKSFTRPLSLLADRTIFSFSRAEMDTMALRVGEKSVKLKQDVGNGTWTVVEPVNQEVDIRRAIETASRLAALRADGVALDLDCHALGMDRPRLRVEVDLAGGSRKVLNVSGAVTTGDGGRVYYACRKDLSRVFVLTGSTLDELLWVFLAH